MSEAGEISPRGEAGSQESATSAVGGESFVHEITPLDNLTSLAVRYRTTVGAIRRLNPGMILAHYISPSTKTIKVPMTSEYLALGTEQENILSPEEEVQQATANERYFCRKSFMARFQCSEEEANYYLEESKEDLELAIQLRREDIHFERVKQFCERVQGMCSLEEARQFLEEANFNVEKAASAFKFQKKWK